MEQPSNPTAKNLVICCDGTGNEISQNISNVLKLYRRLRETLGESAVLTFVNIPAIFKSQHD